MVSAVCAHPKPGAWLSPWADVLCVLDVVFPCWADPLCAPRLREAVVQLQSGGVVLLLMLAVLGSCLL